MVSKNICDKSRITAYLNNELDEESLLDFLLHLDDCPGCRESLYEAIKNSHDHYYRKKSNKKIEKEMRELSKVESQEETEEDITFVA